MSSIVFKTRKSCAGALCTGCRSCMAVCPVNAISCRLDSCGFEDIYINADLCIKCQRCEYVCPVLSTPAKVFETKKRLVSLNSNMSVQNLVDDMMGGPSRELTLFEGEDFFKIDINDISVFLENKTSSDVEFKHVEDMDDKPVVVFGRPCEINGLKNYLVKKKRNVYLVSVHCKGKFASNCHGASTVEKMRPSCMECKQNISDIADLVLLPSDYFPNHGTHMMVVNNIMLYQMLNNCNGFELIELNHKLNEKYGGSMSGKDLESKNNPKDKDVGIISDARRSRSDIGLVAIYTVGNFGGAMTSYAMYKLLINMGYSVLLIERPLNAPHKPAISKIYASDPYPESDKAKLYPDKDSMYELNSLCDSFVVGSDQMFHANLYTNFAEWVTLDWVKDSKKKISYAASFGHDSFTGSEDMRSKMSYFMKKFDYFSVREQSGVNIALKDFGVKATWVLDPVFMCEPEDYSRFITRGDGGYVSAYILDMTDDKKRIVDYVVENFGGRYQLYSEFAFKSDEFKNYGFDITRGTVEDRLSSIVNSDIVVTDSFHGLCFSIIFKKKFVLIRNPLRGSTRFESLLSLLGIEDRMVDTLEDLISKPYLLDYPDYDKIFVKLGKEKKKSMEWLKKALDDPIVKSMSDYDVFREGYHKQKDEIENLKRVCHSLRIKLAQVSMIADPALLSIEDNLYSYLYMLRSARDCTVFISVKDTPGYKINRPLSATFRSLGLKFDLINKKLSGYIAIIDSGKVIFEEVAPANSPLSFAGVLEGGEAIFVESCPLKGGNRSVIRIEGTDYSQNGRGLNIVCYDKKNRKVIDSVVFDTHSAQNGIPASRKKGSDSDV
jgi:NAD-dependent dihydropyrimidine dehydrogenase PreA subunit